MIIKASLFGILLMICGNKMSLDGKARIEESFIYRQPNLYPGASLLAQTVKNLPAIQET